MPFSEVNMTDAGTRSNRDRISILYVDDDQDLLMVGKIFLERSGKFRVDTLTSAQEALRSSQIQSYDAIVSDYQMPGMDGILFLKAFREKFGDIPFILFTGKGREDVVIEAINNGADFYIQKGGLPEAQFAELAHKIRQAVRRKQAEQSLQDSEKRLSDIIEFFPDAIVAIDRCGRVIAWNKATEEMTGIPSNEMLGKGDYNYAIPFYGARRPVLIDMINEPDKKIEQFYSNVYRTGSSVTAETDYPHPKGNRISTLIKACPLYDQSGEIAGAIESIRDITERRLAEEALQKSYALLKGVLESPVDIVIFALDRQYRYIAFNENHRNTMKRIWGADIVLGTSMLEYITNPEDRHKAMVHFDRALSGESFTISEMYGDIDLERRWYEDYYNPIRNENGDIIGLTLVLTDITAQMNTEQDLRNSEMRFLAATINAGSWIWEVDPVGIYTYSSPAVEGILGYHPDELVGKARFSDFFDPVHQKEQTALALKKLNTHEGFRDFVAFYRHKNGSKVILKTSGIPRFNQEGTFLGYYGSDQDITKEKEAESKLLESEARYRLLADNVFDVIWIADEEMHLSYISPSIMKLRGITPKEALEESFIDALTPESFQRVQESHKKWLETLQQNRPMPEKMVMELEFRCKNGSTVLTELIMSTAFDSNNHARILGVTRDISQRKQAEEALRGSEEKFRSFVENASEIVYSLNPDGVFTYISPNVTELLGYEISEIIGLPTSSIVHPDDYPRNLESYRLILRTGKYKSGNEYRLRHKDGTWRWYSQSITPIRNTGGDVIAIQGICHDITRRRQSEETLRKANRQLSLLSGITRHDILNKIAVIRGNLALAEMDFPDFARSESLQTMKSAAAVIQSQIEFTRLYEELGAHEPQWIRLDTLMPRSSLPDTVTLEADLQGVSVFADPMLKKVFFNLLDNSVRHGERVTKIRVSAHESDDNLIIVWEDNGVGIAEEEKEQIFERGFGKNTGLGMFLVREILALTDISIRETGVPGTGARFEISVPGGFWKKTGDP